jgi:peptide/nickel transport system substrate-binding protein
MREQLNQIGANRTELSRRRILNGLGLAGVAGLAGCAGLGSNEDEGDVVDAEGADDALRIAIDRDPGSPLNIWISGSSLFDWMRTLVFDKLIQPNPVVEEPIPGLAKEATQIDANTWQVTVRDGVTWHDGESFTAEDVEFCYRFYRDGPWNRFGHHVNEAPHIENIELEDDKTIRLETAWPAPTLNTVTFADLPVFSKHVWKNIEEPSEYTDLPVGTGPYELVEYEADEYLRFEARDDYWGGETTVDEIVVPVIPDPSTTFTALQTGEIDTTVRSVPPETLKDIEPESDIEVVNTDTMGVTLIVLNTVHDLFRDHELRWALSRAADQDRITDIAMLGEAISGSEGFGHPDSPWVAPDLEIPYEPEAARERLDENGYVDNDGDGIRETPDGEPVSFNINVASTEPQHIRAGQLLEQNWADIGVDATVRTTDPGSVRAEGYETGIIDWGYHMTADPDQQLIWLIFIREHMGGPGVWDASDQPVAGFEELKEAYFEAATTEEMKEALYDLQRLHMSQPVSLPLWYPFDYQAYRPEAYNQWAEVPLYGIHHKWSFLEEDAREGAVTQRFY